MASPSSTLATLRPDLAQTFEEFDTAADRMRFVSHRLFPVINADEAAGTFGKITIESLLRSGNTERAPRSGYGRDDFEFTEDSYATKEHGWEGVVDDNESRRFRHYFDHEMLVAERTRDVVLRNAEVRLAALLFNASTFNTTSVTTEWSTIASATPITDVEAAVQRVYDATGLWPNTLVINKKVFRNLRNCAQIIDRIKYSGMDDPKAENITASMLAEVFQLEQVVVSAATKNTANSGQSASLSPIFSDEYAMVTLVDDSEDLAKPCIGKTIHWGEDGSDVMGHIESYREESARGDIIRVRHQVQEKLLYAELGELLSNITA